MTLPKKHPLYGAVEALAKHQTKRMLQMDWDDVCEAHRDGFRYEIEKDIRALESAGYRVVGPEPTDVMLRSMHRQIDWCRDGQRTNTYDHESQIEVIGGEQVGTTCKQDLLDAWRDAHAAAPTITETEKGE